VPLHDQPSRRTPRRTTPSRAPLGISLALLVTACGAPGPSPMTTFPPTTPPTTTTPSASPSPTTTEPEPTTATPTSRADATWEVVEKFFDAYTYGMQTGDSSRLVPLATEDCATCANFVRIIDELGARDVAGTGGEFLFPYSEGLTSPHADRDIWYIEFIEGAINRTVDDPHESFQQDESHGHMYVELTEHADGWRISSISADAHKAAE